MAHKKQKDGPGKVERRRKSKRRKKGSTVKSHFTSDYGPLHWNGKCWLRRVRYPSFAELYC